jgi:hypothetical protein
LTFSKIINETPHNIDNDHDLLDIELHFMNTPINVEITADVIYKYINDMKPEKACGTSDFPLF